MIVFCIIALIISIFILEVLYRHRIEKLQAKVKEQETTISCLRGLQRAGNDMFDDFKRELRGADAKVKRLKGK